MVFMLPPPQTGMERRRSSLAHAYKRPPAPHPVWSGGVQPKEQAKFGAVAAFGGTLAGLGALGFMPVGKKRVWDYYLKAIRTVEEISPARIFRTFQYSEMLSPFGSNRTFDFPAELFTYTHKGKVSPNKAMRRFISNMLGKPVAELEQLGVFSKGIEFRRTGWMFGEMAVKGGPVLASNALPLRVGSHAGGSFVDWYARLTGIQLGVTEGVTRMSSGGMMAVTVPKVDKVLGIPISEIAQLHLQKARVAGRMARAYMAGQIGRLNRLLAAPADWFPALGNVMKKVGIRSLTIKPGSALQMLGRYTAKGLVIAGAYKGFQYLSYMRSQSDNRMLSGAGFAILGGALGGILRHTRRGAMIGAAVGAIVGTAPLFDKGVIEGAATAYTKASMGYASASQATGLTASRREQEEFMPGITQSKTLLGFTMSGMMTGLLAGYGLKLAKFKQMGIEGATKFMEGQADAIREHARATKLTRPGALGKTAAFFGKKTGAGTTGRLGRVLMRGGWLGAGLGAAAFGALAIGAAWGTGNVLPGIVGADKTPEELERLYTGREDVAVRRGRWWEFGRSPWEGGRVSHYRPHWYRMLMSKAKVKGLWGSEQEKWDASPMLHPVKALFDEEFKYRWEREHYYERPYPMTGTYGSDVPFLAPIAEALGGLIKPPRLMHTEEWLAGTDLEAVTGGRGAVIHAPTAAEHEPAYGLGGLAPGTPVSRHAPDQQLGEFIYRINELRGLTGFLHGAVKESLTGSQDYFDKMEQLETSSRATGAERAYWDKELGGLLGMTEAFRRFLPHRRRQIELYNPIRNMMPEWLPGPDYYVDFLHGDPYTKVKEGEIRLPGRGYEALHPDVAGLGPEEYPLFHRFKILSDVAMYSDQFKKIRREVRGAIRRGELSEGQIEHFNKLNQQVSERKKRKRFVEYRFAQDALEPKRVVVASILPGGLIQTQDQGVIGLGGVEIRGEKGTETYRRKQTQVSDFFREHVRPGMELDIFTHRDPLHQFKKGPEGYYQQAAIQAGGRNLGEDLVDAEVMRFAADDDPFAIQSKYNKAQRALGGFWETITHYESPREYLLPLSPKAKFIHQRSAIEEYERTRVWGTEAAFWQHPIEHFIEPAAQMAKREWFGTTEIPKDIQKRRSIEDYFDKLKWMKFRMLEHSAEQSDNVEAAKEFRAQQRRTLFGVNPYGSLSYVYSAMPSLDRDYYESFKDARSPEERQTIMEMVAPNQRQLYMAQWRNKLAVSLKAKLSMGLIDESAETTLRSLNTSRSAEGRDYTPQLASQYKQEAERGESYADWSRRREAAEYFTEKAPLPGRNWVGWHPHVDLEDVKLKIVDNLGEDIHDYNLWASRQRELVRKPYITDEPLTAVTQHPSELAKAIEGTLRSVLSLKNVQVDVLPSPSGENDVQLEISDNRTHALQAYKRNSNFAEMM